MGSGSGGYLWQIRCFHRPAWPVVQAPDVGAVCCATPAPALLSMSHREKIGDIAWGRANRRPGYATWESVPPQRSPRHSPRLMPRELEQVASRAPSRVRRSGLHADGLRRHRLRLHRLSTPPREHHDRRAPRLLRFAADRDPEQHGSSRGAAQCLAVLLDRFGLVFRIDMTRQLHQIEIG